MSSISMQKQTIELMSEKIYNLYEKVKWLTRERDEARSEVARLRAERDTLLLDARNATPAETLEQRIMDPCIPKSEAEWWAPREIERQRAEIERLRADLALERSRIVFQRGEIEKQRAEIERLRAQVETVNLLKAEIMMLRKALEPLAQLYLWPDDMGKDMANLIRSEDHWSEEANEDADSDVSLKRKYLRAARHALEGKP